MFSAKFLMDSQATLPAVSAPSSALRVPLWLSALLILTFTAWFIGFLAYFNGHRWGLEVVDNTIVVGLIVPFFAGQLGQRPLGTADKKSVETARREANYITMLILALSSFMLACIWSETWFRRFWRPTSPQDWKIIARLYLLMILCLPTLIIAWKYRRTD
jgi:hypothetical protein